MALVTASEYKTYRGLSGVTTYDTLIASLITLATARLERLCGRTSGGFEASNGPFTETFDGDGTPILRVSNGPISSITSVKVGSSSQTTLDASSYTIRGNQILLINGSASELVWDSVSSGLTGAHRGVCFPEGAGNVEVVYEGGYDTVPGDLKLVVYEIMDHIWGTRGEDWSKASKAVGASNHTLRTEQEFVEHLNNLVRPWRQVI